MNHDVNHSEKQNEKKNYFALLGLDVSFDIDKSKLNKNYHDIQKSIHPDNFAHSSDLERRLSVQQSALINDALATLKQPLKRSVYLLSLLGVTLGDNDNSVDPTFLMEQMELREHLSQLENMDDPHAELDNILNDVDNKIKSVIKQLSQLYTTLLADNEHSLESSELLKAKSTTLKMQYLNRLYEECLDKQDDLN